MNVSANEAVSCGRCLVCREQLGLPMTTCPDCATPHHQNCWTYNGGCAVYGCAFRPAEAIKPPPPLPWYALSRIAPMVPAFIAGLLVASCFKSPVPEEIQQPQPTIHLTQVVHRMVPAVSAVWRVFPEESDPGPAVFAYVRRSVPMQARWMGVYSR